jgi:hypothetical protein
MSVKLIKKYFKIVSQIYDYFDYTSGSKVLPIEDYTEFEWHYIEDESIIYFKSKEDKELFSEEGQIYYGQYDDSEMIMFEVYDDVLLIFDAEKEVYFDE